jgi:hypothetical protein
MGPDDLSDRGHSETDRSADLATDTFASGHQASKVSSNPAMRDGWKNYHVHEFHIGPLKSGTPVVKER